MRTQVIFAAAFLLCGAAFGDVDLVKNGMPVAEIVIAPDAEQGVKLAAEDLQKHLNLMSGATLPIVNAPTQDVTNRVYVGESEFTRKLGFALGEFENSGFKIVTADNAVIVAGVDIHRQPTPYSGPDGLKKWQEFCGEKFGFGAGADIGIGLYNNELKIYTRDDLGTWYAVAELLEQLGVRWYAPYENGTVIPEKKTIVIPDQQTRKEAKFARREFLCYAMRNDPEGTAWFKRLKLGNNNIVIFNHTTYDIYSLPEQQALHPEYLACDADGKPYIGYPPGRGMPRYTDPGFRRAAVLYMNKIFEAIPDLAAMSIGPPDGGVMMDARDVNLYGKPDDSIEQKASQYVWDFHVYLANELKKSHPDKYLLYMSGGGANAVPENITEFPDNIAVPFAQPYSAYMVLESTARPALELRKRWHARMQTVRKAPIWDYFLYYRTPEFPRYPVVFTESLQEETQEILPYSDGKFIEIQHGEHWVEGERHPRFRLGVPGLTHLMVYWQSKLFWDPDMDRRKMLEEYYDLYFGPAGAEMKEFYEFAEEVWTRQESRSVTESTGFLKEADVDRYFEILTKARAKAGDGTVYDRRIAQIESEMATLKTLFPNLKRTGPSLRAYQAPAEFVIDGGLSEYQHGWVALRDVMTGELTAKNTTNVILAMGPNKSLIVGAVCYENRMDQLKADCAVNDDASIFTDDVVEIYVNTPERSYFKIVVNPNGAVWTESTDVAIVDRETLPILWNPDVKSAVKKLQDRWTVEIMIPTEDFGKIGPSQTFPWGIQVGRTRFTGGHTDNWAIAPTSGRPYSTMNRWGNLWTR